MQLNNDVRNEKQLQEDLINATKTEKDEINEKYDQLLMEFINQQNYSNENLKKLNNTLNTQELDHGNVYFILLILSIFFSRTVFIFFL